VDSENLTEHVKEHKEHYGLLNSQYSDNLHKERLGSRLLKKWHRQAASAVDSSPL